ncbi:MAG: hypothetical protein WKG07_34190 [Hymenobacter sp.]
MLELLASGLEIEHLLATPAFAAQLPAPPAAPLHLATDDELTQLGTLQTNAAALAVVRRPPETALPPNCPPPACCWPSTT